MIGNCQARAIAQAMRLLLPEATIDYRSSFRLAKAGTAEWRRLVAGHDHVFAHRPPGEADLAELRRDVPLTEIPVLVFVAFHPDLVYVSEPGAEPGRFVQSATGDYHSALVLTGWQLGFTPEETARLFRALTYLDLWDGAAAILLETGRAADYDLSADLLRWSRRGIFMHSVNHPRMFVAADLARGLLRKAGMPTAAIELDAYLPDEFVRQGTWPVYPAIAERYGVEGSEVFLTQGTRTGAAPRALGLPAFIAGSYASYARFDRSRLVCPRVEAWLADPARVADFRSWAGRG